MRRGWKNKSAAKVVFLLYKMHLRGGFQSKKRWCWGSFSALRKSTIAHWCVFWQTFCSNKRIKSHVPVGGLTCFLLSNQAATQSAKAKHCKEADSNDISLKHLWNAIPKSDQRTSKIPIPQNQSQQIADKGCFSTRPSCKSRGHLTHCHKTTWFTFLCLNWFTKFEKQ